MAFGLIVIGDEVLSGRRDDKHFSAVVRMLAQRGHTLGWARVLPDDRPAITAALREAMGSGDVVFSCGGIGATPDDHTRQCAAAASGLPLQDHPEARRLIDGRLRAMAEAAGHTYDPAHPDMRRRFEMGVFPKGASLIPNPYNQIPGFSVGHVHFVPGFPVMAHPMIESLLDGRYASLPKSAPATRAVWVYEAAEASLVPLMERIEIEFPGVRVFSLPSVDHPQRGRHVELGVKGPTAQTEAAYERLLAALSAAQRWRFETVHEAG